MPTTFSPLEIRRRLGKEAWHVPNALGDDSWVFDSKKLGLRVIVSDVLAGFAGNDVDWIHASISHREWMPTYEDLAHLHRVIWPEGHAYQCFVPAPEHINIHARALHLWGRADGARVLPDFGQFGTI